MTVVVVPAGPAEIDAIAVLADEMDRFYGAELEPRELRLRQINDAILGNPPSAHVLLARVDDQPAGFASYSFLWPAVGVTRSLYLKELFVIVSRRRLGVGKLLMRRLFEIAAETGCSRVEWTTDRSNPVAQRFYQSIGVAPDSTKLFYRVEGGNLSG